MKLIGLLFFQLPTLGDFVPSSTERATISKDCGRLGRGVDPCDHYVVDRRAALLALTLGSLGCSDERYDLAVGPDIATVVVVGVGGEQPRAWAFSASEGAVRLTSTELEDDAVRFRLLVVGYRKTLDELELPSGAQELRPDGDPLPPWDASWKMDSRSAGFSPAREVDPALTELRLRRVQAADRCLAANSCFGIQDEVCQTFCEVEPHVPARVGATQPALRPCPSGWGEADDDVVGAWCEPWPGQKPADCPANQLIWPGEQACHPIGAACADFAAGLAADAIYVDDDAAPGGDGRRAAPFRTIAEALPGARTIALGRGSYAGPLVLPAGVALIGACPSETVIRGSSAAPVLTLSGSATVAGLRLEGGTTGLSAAGGTILLSELWLSGATGAGLTIGPATDARLEAVAIRASGGPGLSVRSATLVGRRLSIQGATAIGVDAGSTALTLSDVAISDLGSIGDLGSAGLVFFAGTSSVSRAVIERTPIGGVRAAEGRHELQDLVVRETSVGPDPSGAIVAVHATVALRRAYLNQVAFAGLRVTEGAQLRAEDLIIDDVVVNTGVNPNGIYVDSSGLELRRAMLHCYGDGIEATSEKGVMTATIADVDLVSTQQQVLLQYRRSAIVCSGSVAHCRLERVESASFSNGVQARSGSTVDASDLLIRNGRATILTDLGGRGVIAQDGSDVRLTRAIVERMPGSSLVLDGFGSSIDATDVLLGDHEVCRNSDCNGLTTGVGIVLRTGTSLTLRRFTIEGAAAAGLDMGADASFDLADGIFLKNQVGVIVQRNVERARLLHQIRYSDNVLNWQVLP